MAKRPNLPTGYRVHNGNDCPVAPEQYVDLIIRTAQGLGHSGVTRASAHEWNATAHPDGIGAVVAYRRAQRGEQIDFTPEKLRHRWPEKKPGKK